MIKITCETGAQITLSINSLEFADLSGMELHRAIFTNQRLTGSKFVDAGLRNALFDGADMRGCDLRQARLMNALFVRADLRNSDLRDSILAGAVLDGADLRGADLSGADIGFSSFKGADVRGAKILCKRIFDADMGDIIFDINTVFPEGFKPAATK